MNPERVYDVAMRFYLRQLERKDLSYLIRENYIRNASEILESQPSHRGYKRYKFLLDRHRPIPSI